MGQEFREASLWINSFLSCLLTHNFIISLSLSFSSSTDLSFLLSKAHSRCLVRGLVADFCLSFFFSSSSWEVRGLLQSLFALWWTTSEEKNRYKPSSATDIYFFCLISRTKNVHNEESFIRDKKFEIVSLSQSGPNGANLSLVVQKW